ncbi:MULTISPECIES: endonuclease III [Zoogloea]|uniref:Endonuclease III n=1 Tax=Zoogloea oleivorans TaxID=1552750 RepID=A0A6C2CNY1_9RHOO|nr:MULTISPECIES: endonuclease III [Zoogloea]MDD2668027.1 endonuclease III [Zoogloea sp.]MDY0037669.1 endonuclease III [Zoogloea oleivorans]TYC54915.1 endonuclease III [Zoogloea oleivorans]
MRLAAVAETFHRLQGANPTPTTELEYASPFQLLVAVVLSAQSTDKGVNIATRKLFALAPTPEAMADLGEAGIAEQIKTIGLFRNKAKNTAMLSRQLLERHAGEVPNDRAALEALPGVGRKTANVVLNTIFGEPTMAVDTHIFRLANRTGLAPGKDVVEVEKRLVRRIPKEYMRDAHHWLILHGRYVCTARKPKCGECLIRDLCLYRDKTE